MPVMCRSCLELLPGVPLSVMFDAHMPWLSTLRVESSRMLSVNAYVTQHADVHLELPLSSALCVVAADRFIVTQHSDVHLEWALSSALCVVAADRCLLSHAPHPHRPYHDALSTRSAARLRCHVIMYHTHLTSCAFVVSTRTTVELSCRGGWR